MRKIDKYIELSKNMESTSDGGSLAYHFDDVVLIKYVMPLQYVKGPENRARYKEEAIAVEANKLNELGVNTPKHLDIKREVDEKNDICWVLQERAPGVCFYNYTINKNTPEEQIARQQELLNMPDKQYQKLVTDLIKLCKLGIELKPKNIYYDKNVGITIIDLQDTNEEITNMYEILELPDFIYCQTGVYCYGKDIDEEILAYSSILSRKIHMKLLINMEKVIPDFNKYKRWLLRSYYSDELIFFKDNGYIYDDLSLTEEEYKLFDDYIENIIKQCINKLSSGKLKYWQISANEIKNSLDSLKLPEAWRYHKDNPMKEQKFDSDYDCFFECRRYLSKIVNDRFNEILGSMESNNQYIIEAQEEQKKEKMYV